MRHLGAGRTKKFSTNRQFVKQISNFDSCAGIATARTHLAFLAAVNLHAMGPDRISRSADHRYFSHRADTGQCLATKPHRPDPAQILMGAYLTGCVGLKRQRQIVGVHPPAVINNPNQCASTLFNLDGNFFCPRIDAVLQQFLNDTGRPLDHLSGSDHVDHVVVQNRYLCHEIPHKPQVRAILTSLF